MKSGSIRKATAVSSVKYGWTKRSSRLPQAKLALVGLVGILKSSCPPSSTESVGSVSIDVFGLKTWVVPLPPRTCRS